MLAKGIIKSLLLLTLLVVWPGSWTRLSWVSCTQQLPNMKPSMHMPRCWPIGDEHCGHVARCRDLIGRLTWPSVLRHSQTNMQVPGTPDTSHGRGEIL